MTSPESGTEALGFEREVDAIAAQSRRLAQAVAASDLDANVPSTPQWSVRDLAHHIGNIQSFWAENVEAKNADEMSSRPPSPFPADSDLQAWLGSCTYSLLRALRDAGPDAPCWTWWPKPRTSGAVARHQAQEVAVHRWDAELATTGLPGALPTALAADGVAEFIEIMIGDSAAALSGEVTLTATDTRDSWRVGAPDIPDQSGQPGQRGQLGPPNPPGQARIAEVRAAASDLVLILYRRLPVPDALVDGDPVLVASLLSLADTS